MATQTEDLPTILLVQGSFQIPQVYDKLIHALAALGYPVIHPKLPSCSDTEDPDFPQRSLVDDAAAIQAELTHLIEDEGKMVFVVMHSYGGLVGSEAIAEELSYSIRQGQGLPGGVIHLYYYTAFILNEGQSVLGVFGESPNNDVKPDGRMYLLHGAEKLYNDLPPSEASSWASRLVAQSHKVEETHLTRAAWRYIRSTYLITENDQAVPVPYQEAFAKQAGTTVERCNSGHSPQLSQPDALAKRIHEAATRAVAGLRRGE